jgi:hypothetical protein
MRRLLRFAAVLVAASALVPFLPLYVERTFMRVWGPNYHGPAAEWGWRLCTLKGYWSDYPHLTPEQDPAFWLGVNLALGLVYALLIALGVELLLTRSRRHIARAR